MRDQNRNTRGLAGLALLGPVVFGLAGCVEATGTAPAAARTGLANPASVYCAQLGGRSVPVQTPAGVSHDCVLPNGERIEEWKLFRRDHR